MVCPKCGNSNIEQRNNNGQMLGVCHRCRSVFEISDVNTVDMIKCEHCGKYYYKISATDVCCVITTTDVTVNG